MSVPVFSRLGACVLALMLPLILAAFALAPGLPDEGQIGFSTASGTYLLDVARGNRHPMFGRGSYPPQWSPDGDRLAYVQRIDAGMDTSDFDRVMLADMFSGAGQPLIGAGGSGNFVDQPPAWSPFSPQFVLTYTNSESNQQELLRVQPGNGIVQKISVASMMAYDSALVWTAADRLRYVAVGGGQVQLIELRLEPFETAIVRAWPFETMTTRQAVLSSDGERFILPAILPSDLNFELYRFDSRSSEVINLSKRSSHMDTNPVWSPDDTRVLFRSLNDAGQFLVMAAADGSDQQTIFRTRDGLLAQVHWSPDGQHASVLMNQSGTKYLCVLDLPDGAFDCPASDVADATWRPENGR